MLYFVRNYALASLFSIGVDDQKVKSARAEEQLYTFFIFEPHFDKKYLPKRQQKVLFTTTIDRLNSSHYATKYNKGKKKQKRPTNFSSRFVAMPKPILQNIWSLLVRYIQ